MVVTSILYNQWLQNERLDRLNRGMDSIDKCLQYLMDRVTGAHSSEMSYMEAHSSKIRAAIRQSQIEVKEHAMKVWGRSFKENLEMYQGMMDKLKEIDGKLAGKKELPAAELNSLVDLKIELEDYIAGIMNTSHSRLSNTIKSNHEEDQARQHTFAEQVFGRLEDVVEKVHKFERHTEKMDNAIRSGFYQVKAGIPTAIKEALDNKSSELHMALDEPPIKEISPNYIQYQTATKKPPGKFIHYWTFVVAEQGWRKLPSETIKTNPDKYPVWATLT